LVVFEKTIDNCSGRMWDEGEAGQLQGRFKENWRGQDGNIKAQRFSISLRLVFNFGPSPEYSRVHT
jgi:hypothetical protein